MVSTRRKNYDEKSNHTVSHINLLDLPEEIIIKILENLEFESIVNLRPVSVRMNRLCGYCLNLGFQRLTNQFANYFKTFFEASDLDFSMNIKCDVILYILVDLMYLRKSIGMYIDQKDCVFFCGQIIDEGYIILRFLSNASEYCVFVRGFILVNNFHKYTSKALEHFNNYIKPICLNLRSSVALRKKYDSHSKF